MLIAHWRKNDNIMKLGKENEHGEMLIAECEGGMEVGGERTETVLRQDGYKDVCEVEAPSEIAVCKYVDYGRCFVQVWEEPESESEEDELTAEEALEIITGQK